MFDCLNLCFGIRCCTSQRVKKLYVKNIKLTCASSLINHSKFELAVSITLIRAL